MDRLFIAGVVLAFAGVVWFKIFRAIRNFLASRDAVSVWIALLPIAVLWCVVAVRLAIPIYQTFFVRHEQTSDSPPDIGFILRMLFIYVPGWIVVLSPSLAGLLAVLVT